MTRESALLALLESREAEANAKAEWIAEWVATNRPLLIQQVMDTALKAMAKQAWNDHVAQLHDAMSEEQWQQYQHRSAA